MQLIQKGAAVFVRHMYRRSTAVAVHQHDPLGKLDLLGCLASYTHFVGTKNVSSQYASTACRSACRQRTFNALPRQQVAQWCHMLEYDRAKLMAN
jgi:hypothetical protein